MINIEIKKRPRSPKSTKARIYFWPAKESIVDNLMNRRSRPYRQWLKEIVLPAVRGLGYEGVDLRWSQKAGCRCGCSPGFIDRSGIIRTDLHVREAE